MMMSGRTYIAIDLKAFYASVECLERGLNPLTTHLVVADESRTSKTICLAVSPALKAHGIGGWAPPRARGAASLPHGPAVWALGKTISTTQSGAPLQRLPSLSFSGSQTTHKSGCSTVFSFPSEEVKTTSKGATKSSHTFPSR